MIDTPDYSLKRSQFEWFIYGLFLFLILLLHTPLKAELYAVPRKSLTGAALGNNIGNGMGNALAGMQEARQAVAQFNIELKEARKDYFDRFPDKSGFPEAAQKFNQLLFEKDLMLMNLAIAKNTQKQLFGDSDQIDMVLKLTGADIDKWDGGVPQNARVAFGRFTSQVIEGLGKDPLLLFARPETLSKAFVNAQDEYLNYLDKRNFGEFRAAGRGKDYFPNSKAYVQYLLRHNTKLGLTGDRGLLEVYGVFVNTFGEDFMLESSKKLLNTELSFIALPKDHEAFGLTYGNSRNGADKLVQFLSRDCAANAFLLAHLSTSYDKSGLQIGKLSTDARIKEYGATRVASVVKMLQGLPINPDTDYIAEGEFEKLSYRAALRKALPLTDDPGLKLWQERKDAEKRAKEKIKQEKQEELEKARIADSVKNGREQYDHFRLAFTELKAMNIPDSHKELRLYELEVIAGYWNHFVVNGRKGNIRGETYKKFQHFISKLPAHERKQFRAWLDFLRLDQPQYPGRIKALEIEHGEREAYLRISFDAEKVFRHSPDRFRLSDHLRRRVRELESRYKMYETASKSGKVRLQDQMAKLREEIETLEMKLAEFDRNLGREPEPSLLAELDEKPAQLQTPAEPTPSKLETETTPIKPETSVEPSSNEIGNSQFKAYQKALKIARAADTAKLAELNAAREKAGLAPLSQWLNFTELVQLSAGFWNQEDARNASSALSFIRKVDRETYGQLAEVLSFVLRRSSSANGATSLAEIQQQENEKNVILESARLELRASREKLKWVDRRQRATSDKLEQELRFALAKSNAETKESSLKRIESRLERARHDEKEILDQLAALDDGSR